MRPRSPKGNALPRLPALKVPLQRVERVARELRRLVHGSGSVVLTSVRNPSPSDRATARLYLEAKFAGFHEAQEVIVEGLLRLPPDDNEAFLLRKFADSMAWRLIGFQLYIARRLYRRERQPSLKTSNFDSVRLAASELTGDRKGTFALFSDTTSFVQLSDLIVTDLDEGALRYVEVKSGDHNKRILDALQFHAEGHCDAALALFLKKHGQPTLRQMQRMARQARRLGHVRDLLRTGRAHDPDLGLDIVVPDKEILLKTYDRELAEVLEASHGRGWAITVIDDCLFVGAYRGAMLRAAPVAFRAWLRGDNADEPPYANLMQSMTNPLALPVFDRAISEEQMFDLVAGRASAFVGLHLEEFARRARARGIGARWGTRKEAARFANEPRNRRPITVNNRPLILERNGAEMALMTGILERVFFHGTRPDSVLDLISESLRNLEVARARTMPGRARAD